MHNANVLSRWALFIHTACQSKGIMTNDIYVNREVNHRENPQST